MSILERRKVKAASMVLAAPIAALGVSGFGGSSADASPITNGDLVIYQSGTASAPDGNGGSPINIDEINPSVANTLVQQFNVTNLTGNNSAATSTTLYCNSNGSNGQLTMSDNGTLVAFGGYQGFNSNELQQTIRQAGAISQTGVFTTADTYTESSNGQVRSAYSADGSAGSYLFADKSGVYTTAGQQNSTNVRFVAGFGSTVFALAQGSGSNSMNSFYTYSSGTLTAITVPGGNFANGTDFDFLQLGGASDDYAYDTLYVGSATQILKYGYSGGTLTSEGADTVTGLAGNIIDLTAAGIPGGVELYFTEKTGVVGETEDTSGYDASIGNTASTTIYSAGTGADLFGIVYVPEPTTVSLLAISGLALLRRRRRSRSVAM